MSVQVPPNQPPPNPFASVNWGPTIGVAYLGVVISSVFYGVTCVQTFYYFRTSGRDGWAIKSLVLSLLILDSTHQALIIHVLYFYLIDNYGYPFALQETIWSIPTEIMVNAVIAFLVETFLALRIWKLSSNLFLVIFCESWVITHFALNLIFPIKGLSYTNLQEAVLALKSTGTTGLAVAVVTDVILAACLVFYLNKSRTGFQRSDDMITKLITLTITTGLLTTIFVGGNLIAYVVAPQDLYLLFFNFMLGKLYINSLLTSLNSREAILKAGRINQSSHHMNSFNLNQFRGGSSMGESTQANSHIAIDVKKTIETDHTAV